ncbi:NADH dehydrogenase [ubiquinone] 1 subunit C2-like [Eriocheir sinensis]|uniref:NADH dehydrogenase [ubiquinone] 1 subunit C2-like n=1 Tax=Eriocheir sinensis TaxID=95602 RepID=UPI0021CAAE42|nr:NADH dehydrogenase [ubiquinone] 1 subunit C2-like [Eriocheir sinensis]
MMEADTRTEINPADYFSPDARMPDPGLYRKLWYPVVMGGLGVSVVAFTNIYTRRPTWSGLQRHIIAGSAGLVLGILTDRWTKKQAALRDNIYYNYILSHPEDFPPIERKKYKEVLHEWIPIR